MEYGRREGKQKSKKKEKKGKRIATLMSYA
jgi:hypothetical protein